MFVWKFSRVVLCPLVLAAFSLSLSASQATQDLTKADDGGSSSSFSVPAGQPLTEGEIIVLLQAKVPLDVVQKFVSVRGVAFVSSKETSRKILTSGGNVALIGTISLNQHDDVPTTLAMASTKKKK
jgi:hypothetical protein